MIRTKLKIILVLIISFGITIVLTKNLFLANSPKLNNKFLSNLKNIPGRLIAFLANIGKSSNKYGKLPLSALKPIASGVYAAEDNKGQIVYMRVTENIEYEERTIGYNGKQFKVLFPKGSFK